MKKIAFIATGYIKKYDGISVYTENLLFEFLNKIQINKEKIKVDIYIGTSVIELLKSRLNQQNLINKSINIIKVNDTKTIYKIINLNIALIKTKYDLIFMANFIPTLFLPSKTLKVIHDFSVNNFPELYSKKYLIYHNFLITYAKYFDHGIGYISNATKSDLNDFHKINDSNKELLHLQNGIPFKVKNYDRPSDSFFGEKYRNKDLEFLVVGRINKHKGFDRILDFLKYFDKAKERNNFSSIKLNIVGKQTEETTKIFKDLELQNIEIVFHGFLNDEDLNNLYIKSQFCLFLSRNEGYGIPLVEALWFKSIPIISNIPIFREIMGEEYQKFDDNTGYSKEILNFILNIYQNPNYLEKQKKLLDQIVITEANGYKHSSNNLINFINTL